MSLEDSSLLAELEDITTITRGRSSPGLSKGALSCSSDATDVTLGFEAPTTSPKEDLTMRRTASLDALVHAALFLKREPVPV